MLNLKSKHRCQCYSQSASFLYGLRRDAPSTERVLLERLLNILSRAAALKNKNPQRLWAESERPEWWPEVTKLSWKNPREHPKDNKDTLKKKIEVLETELRKRKLMTKELEEELAIHRGSKKIDLELKSDFEAVITKASGLHFMLDKVYSKMGQSRIISDKMASYIGETKSCIDKIYRRINQMHEQVQEREERKSDLWAAMGVSKHQRPVMDEDFMMDTFTPDADLDINIPGLYEDLPGRLSPKLMPSQPPTSPSSTSVTLSPEPSELSDSAVMQKLYTPQPTLRMPPESFFFTVLGEDSSLESSRSPRSGPSSSATIQRSLSQPDSAQIDPEIVRAVDLSQGRSASVTLSSLPKRSWRQSASERGELTHEQTKVKSRRTQQSETMVPTISDFIVINEEEDDMFWETIRSPASVASNPASPTSVLETRPEKDPKQTTEAEPARLKLVSKHQRSPRSSQGRSVSLFGGLRSPASTASQPKPQVSPAVSDLDLLSATFMVSSSRVKPDWPKRTEIASRAKPSTTSMSSALVDTDDKSSPLAVDVVEDGGGDFEYLDIVEESNTPTISMYEPDASGMDQLAEMTTALSCEDLSASVTENVMTGVLPAPGHASGQVSSASRGKPHRPFEKGSDIKVRSWTPVTSMVRLGTNKLSIRVTDSPGVGTHGQVFHSLGASTEKRQQQFAQHRPRMTVVVPSKEETEEESLSKAIGGLGGAFLH